ncbi:MAG: amino acid ABC transporter permease [Actinocatenispora sp.]
MNDVVSHIGVLVGGLGVTLELSLLGFAGALVLGTLLTIMRVSPITPLTVAGTVYVEVFRNVPLLAFLVLFVFGLPDAGISYSLFTSEAVCLAMYFAAYVCEAVRAGINAVSVGQAEAARALGMTFSQSLGTVILPQAFRTMVQPLANIFIGVVLASSLGAAVGVSELTGRTQVLDLQYDEPVPTFIAATLGYVLVTLAVALLAGRIQKRMAVRR